MSFAEVAYDFLAGAHTELFFFVLAVSTYSVFFGRYKIARKSPKDKASKRDLASAVQPLLHGPTEAIQNVLSSAGSEDMAELLQTLGSGCTEQLASAVLSSLQLRGLKPSGRLAELLLQALWSLRLKPAFWELVHDLEATSQAAGTAGQMNQACLCLAVRAGLSDDLVAAKRLLGGLAKPQAPQGTPLLWHVLVAAARKDVELARLVLKCMPKEAPPQELASILLKRSAEGLLDLSVLDLYTRHLAKAELFKQGNSDAAFIVLTACLAQKVAVEDFLGRLEAPKQALLLRRLGQEQKMSEARKIFATCPPSGPVFNAMIEVCADSRDLVAAASFFQAAQAAGLLDADSHSAMARAHVQTGDMRGACKIMETIKQSGMMPSVTAFNDILEAMIADGKAPWDLLADMTACGVSPNRPTCTILLKHIQPSNAHDLEKALSVVSLLEDSEVDEVLATSILEACMRAGRKDVLASQLRKLNKFDKAAKPLSSFGYGAWIRAYSFAGDVPGAMAIWREMKSRQISISSISLGCIVEALASNGDPEAGYQMIHSAIRDPDTQHLVNAVVYGSVVKGLSQQKKFDRLFQVEQEMRDAKLQFSATTYNALINACVCSGRMSRVEALLEEMQAQGIEPNTITFSTIVKGYCQDRESLEKARGLLEDMRKSEHVKPDEVTFNTVLDGCARFGLFDKGLKVLEDMQAMGIHPTNFTLALLAKLAIRSRRPALAFVLCEEVARQYQLRYNVHVYNNLLQAATAMKEMPRAMALFDSMVQDGIAPDPRSYTLLLKGCAANGAVEEATVLLRTALKLRGSKQLGSARAVDLPQEVVIDALEFLAVQGPKDAAVKLMQEMRQIGLHLEARISLRLANQAVKRN